LKVHTVTERSAPYLFIIRQLWDILQIRSVNIGNTIAMSYYHREIIIRLIIFTAIISVIAAASLL